MSANTKPPATISTPPAHARPRSGVLAACVLAAIALALAAADRPAAKQHRAQVEPATRTAPVGQPARADSAVGARAPSRAEPRPATPATATATAAAQQLAGDLRAALSPEQRAAYAKCTAISAQCQATLNELTQLALLEGNAYGRIDRLDYEPKNVETPDAPAMSAALGEFVANASDPLERLSALLLLNHHPAYMAPGRRAPLPEGAYRDLALRPFAEMHLFSELHRLVAPPSAATARQFLALADSDDVRFQRAAMLALGHVETATELNELTVKRAYPESDFPDLARAISACGTACSASVQHMMQLSSRARVAMYQALGVGSEEERIAMTALALNYAPKDIDDAERATRAEFLGD